MLPFILLMFIGSTWPLAPQPIPRVSQNVNLPAHCHTPCGRPSKIELLSPPSIEVRGENLKVRLHTYPRTIMGLRYKVRRYTETCPPGLTMYPQNEKCKSHIKTIQPSLPMAAQVLKNKKCLIGPSCRPDSNECDHGGILHCEDDAPLNLWTEAREFSYHRIHRKNFFTSSCVVDWECSIEEVTAPIETRADEIKGVEAFIYSTNGAPLILDTDADNLFHMDDGSYLMFPSLTPATTNSITVKCIVRNERYMCITSNETDVPDGLVFKLNANCAGNLANHVVIAPCGKLLEPSQDPRTLGPQASISQVKIAMNQIFFEQLQSQHNDLELALSLNNAQNLFSKLVIALSKRYPTLIGEILDRDFATTWVNEDIFMICPCQKLLFEGLCTSRYYLNQGEIRERSPSDDCFPLKQTDPERATPLGLFSNISLSLEMLRDLDLLPQLNAMNSKTIINDSEDSVYYDPQPEGIWAWLKRIGDEVWSMLTVGAVILSWVSFLSNYLSCLRPVGRRLKVEEMEL